jgi:hypothetical protein
MQHWYVGISALDCKYVAFRADVPDADLYGRYKDLYIALIGPFRTKRGAIWAAKYGKGNPHFQHVNDAEKLATLDAKLVA